MIYIFIFFTSAIVSLIYHTKHPEKCKPKKQYNGSLLAILLLTPLATLGFLIKNADGKKDN